MSKITKTICDNCEKELDYNEWYLEAKIIEESNSSEIGRQICDGDYCKKCFKEKVSRI